jgi:hypothetical protein
MLNRLELSTKQIKGKIDFFGFSRRSIVLLINIIFLISILGCQKDDFNKRDVDSGNYSGTFEGNELNITQDSVYLNISKGYYYCTTNLPYNYGAGILEITETTLNFIDTLFFPIPALYITGFALSGEYEYQYDGETLIIEKITDTGNLTYRMKKE